MNEPAPSDEPKPIRRSAFSHALSGFTLLVCIGVSMWLLEQAGWTDFGQKWTETQGRWFGPEAMRERVKPGMTHAEVTERIGLGKEGRIWFPRIGLGAGYVVEEYPEHGFIVVYSSKPGVNKNAWKVFAVKDLSQADSPPWAIND